MSWQGHNWCRCWTTVEKKKVYRWRRRRYIGGEEVYRWRRRRYIGEEEEGISVKKKKVYRWRRRRYVGGAVRAGHNAAPLIATHCITMEWGEREREREIAISSLIS